MALAVILAGCGGGGDAELGTGQGLGETPSTAPGGSLPPPGDPQPGTTVTPGPGGEAPPGNNPPGPADTRPPARPSELAGVQLRLTRLAGLAEPLAMAVRLGDGALYIAEKGGRVRAIRGGGVDPAPVLDIAGEVGTDNGQGLLGLVFSPDGSRMYLNFTDPDANTHVVEYVMAGGQADPATRRELLFVEQPAAGNKGGNLVFGPDARLWIGLGDGGGGGDPADNAQSVNSLLGKLLRIDPRANAAGPYGIPPDNPFAGGGGRGEIWAYGLRQPWRFSFDRSTGDLWIGDVGQAARDEVDFQRAGAGGGQNYGWARLEGTRTYSGRPPADAVGPILDYARTGGNCAITGGYVYRGARIPALVGAYVFADLCVGQLRAVRQTDGQIIDERAFPVTVRLLVSFGQDQGGELYVLSQEGGVFRIDPG
ncbi:MAG: PQQ-dependent sugar dehydrogenase [Actinobacteria bacterium]|nr:PQQ-dependent sugar dehydrogenase [Actinomycetota bacterium]